MSKTISVADDVYNWMKRKKDDRSFSEVIRSLKSNKTSFKEVNGINAADWKKASISLDKASAKTWEKMSDR